MANKGQELVANFQNLVCQWQPGNCHRRAHIPFLFSLATNTKLCVKHYLPFGGRFPKTWHKSRGQNERLNPAELVVTKQSPNQVQVSALKTQHWTECTSLMERRFQLVHLLGEDLWSEVTTHENTSVSLWWDIRLSPH